MRGSSDSLYEQFGISPEAIEQKSELYPVLFWNFRIVNFAP